MKNKTTDELIEEMGYLLIRLREDPTLEFEPRVFKSKLEEIAQTAKAEGAREERERVVKLLESKKVFEVQLPSDDGRVLMWKQAHNKTLDIIINNLTTPNE